MGYLRFCRRMELIVQLPFTAVATGNSAALLMVLWSPPHYDSPDTQWPLRSVLLAEVFTVSTLLVYYTWNVQEHRNVDKLPDVHQSLTSALRASAPLDNCRYDDGDLAERQAELIRFQQDSVRHLSREILRLQERLSKYESSEDGGNTREDMENILAAREQSVGALTAEHVDENARLRAMLDEWSARNAKMEIAYEQEKRRYNELRRRVAASASSSGLARKPSSSTSLATPSLAQSPPVS
ncbi:hypothetical protein CBR_g26318 [Chara braunii]|uniref:Uncharacterized protein n=1 Tax=Chara braunii TaxID=69332 RepID=A0A388L7N5_CHABU|nr:hypothetical protein CBR_g26318 [Chara braunii]|eukprot:GBG78288.1 hypothetical protein CBR_g26318 [Chara braunii]